jgi:hypothetical protein
VEPAAPEVPVVLPLAEPVVPADPLVPIEPLAPVPLPDDGALEVELPLDMPLPDVELPDVELPEVELPDVELPGWVL